MRFVSAGIVFLLLTSTACQRSFQIHQEIRDLSGFWKFKLDPDNAGMAERWFSKAFTDFISLPGSTDENQKGVYLDERTVDRLSRLWYWKGAAWYQKELVIPEHWSGKHVALFLERTKDTYVWSAADMRTP
jgi:beta-galactosidase/beta-glucuronidase